MRKLFLVLAAAVLLGCGAAAATLPQGSSGQPTRTHADGPVTPPTAGISKDLDGFGWD